MSTDAHIPTHVGLILDGNRRWARQHDLPLMEGHRRGYDNLRTILEEALDMGVEYVSAYVFSTENWTRTKLEVNYLMKLIMNMLTRDLRELHERGIRIVWLGSKQQVGKKVQRAIEDAEALTAENTRGTFGLCFNHGGHREIAEAVQRMVADGIAVDEMSEAKIAEYIDYPDVPPIDLVIRTSGEERLSNFMLWRAAYSELAFTDTLWPDFNIDEFKEILAEYAERGRRFGK
ncbi:MAG TPA: polyprenyl diphosphate synthase [Candidatus Microsaccharimonas sp.]|nr:polyprenyl diphosphate synthase [Candidatus Microsaccharimonas sp.]